MFDYENELIGLFIGHYRSQKAKEDNSFTKKEFINYKSDKILELCANCKKHCANKRAICSYKTIITIENGKPVKNICYYIDFSDKLQKQYIMNKKMIDTFNYIEKEMIYLIKMQEKLKVEQFKIFMESLLDQYPNVIYFTDMIEFTLQMIDYLITGQAKTFNMIKFYEENYPHFNLNWQYLILYYLFQYYRTNEINHNKAIKYILEINSLGKNNIEMNIIENRYLMDNENFLNYITTIIDQAYFSYDLYSIYMHLTQVAFEMDDYDLARNTIEKCIAILNESSVALLDILYYKTLVKKAMVLFACNRYDECLELYKKVIEFDMNLLSNDLLFFVNCIKRNGQHHLISKFINYEIFHQITEPNLKKLYSYYLLLYCSNCSVKILQKYIIDYLLPILKNNSHYYNLLREDMFLYCRTLNNYSNLTLFDNVIAEIN